MYLVSNQSRATTRLPEWKALSSRQAKGSATLSQPSLPKTWGLGSRSVSKRVIVWGVLINLTVGATIICLLQLFSRQIMGLFSSNIVIIDIGVKYLKFMSYFYLVTGITTMMQGLFRGLGKIKVTMAFSGLQILIRVICAYLLVPTYGVYGICFAVVSGWLIQALLEGILVRKQKRELEAMSFTIPNVRASDPSAQ